MFKKKREQHVVTHMGMVKPVIVVPIASAGLSSKADPITGEISYLGPGSVKITTHNSFLAHELPEGKRKLVNEPTHL